MKEPVFQGSCTAMITPFRGDEIDFGQMEKLLEYQWKNGTKAVVLAGTTGENATIEIHEYERLVDFSVAKSKGKLKTIVGIGGNNTAACLNKARYAQRAGADAVLMTPPYYNKTTQQGIVRHYCHVADAIEIPVILYNVPGRTVLGIAPETYTTLSQHPNINGVKEASGDLSLAAYLISECGDALHLWSGSDDLTIPMMAMGAEGVISVASNVVPSAIAELTALCLRGDYAAARSLYKSYAELIRLLFVETNPIPVKAAMALCGLDSGKLRLPLLELGSANREMLKACMKNLGLPVS